MVLRGAIAFIAMLIFFSAAAVAEKRVALVIGNSAYLHTAKLTNPKNDATDMASALKRHGVNVIEGFDLDKPAFERKVLEFAAALKGAEAGLFFYAGHGLQVAGQNYLVPIDAKAEAAEALEFEMVRVDIVHRIMERHTNTNILFLDACRYNPLARNLARSLGTRSFEVGRGLAAVESGVGTLISFSTQPGNVALDGAGRNSPFAGSLIKHMTSANDDLSAILISVRNDVMKVTQRKQVSWEHSALTSKFYFVAPEHRDGSADQLKEVALWETIQESNNAALFEAYLKRYPAGRFASFARDKIRELEAAVVNSAAPRPGDDQPIAASGQVSEVQERLYELNYNPGPTDGTITRSTEQAIREFEARSGLPPSGRLSEGLLRRLRSVDGLKPWGSIVLSEATQKWGMSWGHATRKAAVAAAQASCGPHPTSCTKALTFSAPNAPPSPTPANNGR